jgi:hypothetical protein
MKLKKSVKQLSFNAFIKYSISRPYKLIIEDVSDILDVYTQVNRVRALNKSLS